MKHPAITLLQLHQSVQKAVAIRAIVRLEPAGGPDEKIFPSTYEDGHHCFEQRRVRDAAAPGGTRIADCVLLDSVPSQGNRLEEALQRAIDSHQIEMPLLTVNFSNADKKLEAPVERVTALQAPHRCYDAILRDSELEGLSFRESPIGKSLTDASVRDASSLLEYAPTSLIFGAWDSSGPKGGLGVKFARIMSCEMVGVDVSLGKKTASRLEPLGIKAKVSIVKSESGWDFAKEGAKQSARPSEIMHGNVTPTIKEGGVTLGHAEQTVVISLAGLRKIGFGSDNTKAEAARTLLASLGLLSYAYAAEQGWDLRSRCLLIPSAPVTWEILDPTGGITKVSIDTESALAVYKEAITAARKVGIKWDCTPVELKPSDKLVELVKKSQAIAVKDSGSAE